MSIAYLGIDHLGIAVRDLNAATHTYGQVLGLVVGKREELLDRGLAVCFVHAGPERLELIAPLGADSEISAFLAKRGEGLHHVALRVASLDQALADLRATGARLIDETPRAGAHGCRVAFVHPKATHGVLWELVEVGGEHV